jgi:hypothetical protein
MLADTESKSLLDLSCIVSLVFCTEPTTKERLLGLERPSTVRLSLLDYDYPSPPQLLSH